MEYYEPSNKNKQWDFFTKQYIHRWASQGKTLASLSTNPLTNFTPPLTLIRYFQL